MPSRTPARVAVVFGPGACIRPVWFEIDRRKHQIRETTYHWRDRIGDTPLLHYAVSDGEGLYELVYNGKEHIWTLIPQECP